MEEVIIDIDTDGSVRIEGKGFKGTTCKDLTAAIEKELGDVQEVKLKPEYREARAATRKATA